MRTVNIILIGYVGGYSDSERKMEENVNLPCKWKMERVVNLHNLKMV